MVLVAVEGYRHSVATSCSPAPDGSRLVSLDDHAGAEHRADSDGWWWRWRCWGPPQVTTPRARLVIPSSASPAQEAHRAQQCRPSPATAGRVVRAQGTAGLFGRNVVDIGSVSFHVRWVRLELQALYSYLLPWYGVAKSATACRTQLCCCYGVRLQQHWHQQQR